MDESDFKGSITGEVRWGMNGNYCYFHPHDLPFDWLCSREVQYEMGRASTELARLDGMLMALGDESVRMLTMNLTLKESASSSSIEGTRSTVDDVFRSEKEIEKDEIRSRDNQEIVNYRRALIEGFSELPVGGDITTEMIKGLHRTLMESVRSADKSPGEFKTHQNAIGMASDTLETAKMVPASPESVDHLLDNWVRYVNSDSVNTVEKLSMAHYQFEAIHPFRDGNGGVGRLLSLMILRRDGLLRYPILYLSGYLNTNRAEYIERLYRVSSEDSIDEWLSFLARGLFTQAKSTAVTVEALLGYRTKILAMAENINESRTMELLFRNPYVTVKDVCDSVGVSAPTAGRVLDRLCSAGILREVTGKSRNRLYRSDDILGMLS